MLYARIVGTATSTVKHVSLAGWKLLVAQPLAADHKSSEGDPVLVVDQLGAGVGSLVMITGDCQGNRELLGDNSTPVCWSVLGLEDERPR
ncbi:MAG: EutN/CcmL family microcompartment protein [Pirellulales bacterium]|nr:EutN/CcmL family microcompartment protein [Pirellulales bacterium]